MLDVTKYDPYIAKMRQIAYFVFNNFPGEIPPGVPLYAVMRFGGEHDSCPRAPRTSATLLHDTSVSNEDLLSSTPSIVAIQLALYFKPIIKRLITESHRLTFDLPVPSGFQRELNI